MQRCDGYINLGNPLVLLAWLNSLLGYRRNKALLAASGIPARCFDLNQSGLFKGGGNAVQVIEITKMAEENRGGGVSVRVEAFEGRNLIFVDEGHKGSGGEVWRRYGDALGATRLLWRQ